MINNNDKQNFIDYIIIASAVFYIVLAIIFKVTGYFIMITSLSLGILLTAVGIVAPLNDYFKRGKLRDRKVIFLYSVRKIPLVMLLITVYEIVFRENYNLKYTYWIALLCIAFELYTFMAKALIAGYKKRKSENKKHNLLTSALVAAWLLLPVSFYGYNLLQPFAQPKRQIFLYDLKVPKSISVYKFESNNEKNKYKSLRTLCEITLSEDIEKVTKELKDISIENISSTDLLNYERMKYNNYPYYLLLFHYTDANSAPYQLENGYIRCIAVTNNRHSVIEEMNVKRPSFLTSKYYNEVYPINLSDDAIDLIFSLAEKNK